MNIIISLNSVLVNLVKIKGILCMHYHFVLVIQKIFLLIFLLSKTCKIKGTGYNL